MTRKLMMITTAIVALAAAPAVFAQTAPAPSGNQVQLQKAPAGEVKTDQLMKKSEAPKVGGKVASKSTARSHDKMIHKTSASTTHRGKAHRDMNDREVQMTRDLNRQSIGGQQSAMAPMPQQNPNALPMQGAVTTPEENAGAAGPNN